MFKVQTLSKPKKSAVDKIISSIKSNIFDLETHVQQSVKKASNHYELAEKLKHDGALHMESAAAADSMRRRLDRVLNDGCIDNVSYGLQSDAPANLYEGPQESYGFADDGLAANAPVSGSAG